MANQTSIEWCDTTWNPTTGCSPISAGCERCYAARFAKRLAGRCGYPEDNPFKVTLHPDRLDEPLKWRKPKRVFVCSMGDLFHEDIPEMYIVDTFSIMAEAYWHTFIVLTKRPQRMKEVLTSPTVANDVWLQTSSGVNDEKSPWPLPNVWFGVTAENQETADERIPILLQIPAAVRFVSCEPLLEPVSFRWAHWVDSDEMHRRFGRHHHLDGLREIDWVIVGGESGPDARPVHPNWVRDLQKQCQTVKVPFFFKQWGEWALAYTTGPQFELRRLADDEVIMKSGSGGQVMKKVGKKKAGRLLDGRTWDETPISLG